MTRFPALIPRIIQVDGAIYAVAYESGGAGTLSTFEILADGTIAQANIDTLLYDATTGADPTMLHVDGNIFAIAYNDDGDLGQLKTVDIAADGSIGSVLSTLQFEAARGREPSLVHVDGNVFAIAYHGADDDGWFLQIVECLGLIHATRVL